jgi:ribonuclease HI
MKKPKTLKLDKISADAVQNGALSNTWRLYDDKDLRVDDHVDLINKVDPGDPASWNTFLTVVVDMIIEKRLGDVTEAEMAGHFGQLSRDEVLTQLRAYYGRDVGWHTPVKMVYFHPVTQESMANGSAYELKLYADGGSRGNPGPSAAGFALYTMRDELIAKRGEYLGVTTNNQAEYQAVRTGLEEAKQRKARVVHVYLDSLLVVNQMRGEFKVKNRELWGVHGAMKDLVATFEKVVFTHVPRELNRVADAEVNVALDDHERQQAQK